MEALNTAFEGPANPHDYVVTFEKQTLVQPLPNLIHPARRPKSRFDSGLRRLPSAGGRRYDVYICHRNSNAIPALMKKVLIEGWRGICHSFAMVNQYQLLEMSGSPTLSICHSDLPYYIPQWADSDNDPGFPLEMENLIRGIPEPRWEIVDTVYRIGFPFGRTKVRAKRVVTFMVTALGVNPVQFPAADTSVNEFCGGDDFVVTPSNWSRQKLLEYGFPAEKVRIVPHGVNSSIFSPLSVHERDSFRRGLEISDDDFVFLNVGALFPNKGVDRLIDAFAQLRQRYGNARLILKDSSGLYLHTVTEFIANYMKQNRPLSAEVLNSIFMVPSNLSLAEMRLLYGGADVYVSPYKAEGFNLPVIESIASGTPVIVTDGGATDDFCDPNTSLKIASDLVAYSYHEDSTPDFCLEPRLDSLIENMERALTGNMPSSESFEHGRRQLIDKFSWTSVTRQLEAML